MPLLAASGQFTPSIFTKMKAGGACERPFLCVDQGAEAGGDVVLKVLGRGDIGAGIIL